MKVLFVSYYFDPFPGVGAKRTSYWADNAARFGLEVDVITATQQKKDRKNIFYLPAGTDGGVLGKLIKDPGLHWKKKLLDHFKSLSNFDYDVVLFSGGPFMHFGTGEYLQKRFGCKVIIDYRDPFGNNPRHNDSWMKKSIKTFFEKRFNRMADCITTVNDICKADMTYSEKVIVIPNGYDDQVLGEQKEDAIESPLTGVLLNGGKLYNDFKMEPLLEVVTTNENLIFKQVGREYDHITALGNDRIVSSGFIPYEDLLSEINQAEICTVLTGGEAFETPTKTYDYIALNKKILVITEGKVNTGGIQSILGNYPNVEWTVNNTQSIRAAIKKLQSNKEKEFESYPFSRAYGLEKLVDLLKSL